MRSPWEFLVIALVVTLTPGPATATILRVAARDGRRAAVSAVGGNSIGVFMWGALSAVGVSGLVLASHVAYDVLRIGGAVFLVVLGIRSLLGRRPVNDQPLPGRKGFRAGLLTSVSNPKLAAFFVALFPQFLRPGAPVLPLALGMAATIVVFDLIWFSVLGLVVERAGGFVKPRVMRRLERTTGAAMIGFGLKLAADAR